MKQLTEAQKLLIDLLKISGAEKDLVVGVVLSLDEYPEATENFLLWLDEFNPERRKLTGEELSTVLEKMVELIHSETSTQER